LAPLDEQDILAVTGLPPAQAIASHYVYDG
jgi:hypothetical protein